MPLSGAGSWKARQPSLPAGEDEQPAALSFKQTLSRETRCELQDIFVRVCSSIPPPPLHPVQQQLLAEGRLQEEEAPQYMTLEHLSHAIGVTTRKDVR